MATIKSYTDLEQSKKLVEILPLESADMHSEAIDDKGDMVFIVVNGLGDKTKPTYGSPVWSLAALLRVLPKEVEIDGQRYAPCLFPIQDKWLLKLWYNSNHTITSPIAIFSDNPVDACVEMILRLNELNLL